MPIPKNFDKDFFKRENSDMTYVLGFLCADGNIVKTKRGTHFVSFHSSDRDLLVYVKKVMKSSHVLALRSSRSGRVYRLQIGSRELYEDLVKRGLTSNKARRMRMPVPHKSFLKEFIKGYFDGDGNVWMGFINKKRPTPTQVIQTSFTSASGAFLNDLATSCRSLGLEGGAVHAIKGKNCFRLTFSTADSLKLYEIMYNTPHLFCLKRKRKVFESFIQKRKKRP